MLLLGLWASGCTASPPPATPAGSAPAGTSPGATPQRAPAGARVEGRLPPTHIQEVVRAQRHRILGCYERSLATDRNAEGRTSTRFVIERDGSVRGAMTSLEGSLAPWIRDCVDSVFRSLQFQRPEGGPVSVTYPFVFDRVK